MTRLSGVVRRIIVWFLVLFSAIIVFTLAKNQGWLSPLGIKGTTRDSQVVTALERTQEVALLRLGIQGITEEKRCSEVFGSCVPGTGEQVFLQYEFKANLGIDGSKVQVTETGEHGYQVDVPGFEFLGYDEPTFKVAVQDGGVLSWVTEDIDHLAMVNDILDDSAQDDYLDGNTDLLQDQTKVFYDSLITSIDEDAKVTYVFDN